MEGLVKFREAFAEYSENYVVIGGAACDITMTNTVVRPRATHDIDMIVIVENMTEAFANRFGSLCGRLAIDLKRGNRRLVSHQGMKCIVSLMVKTAIPR
ncbi:hypothetical protein NXW48_20510 [Phocaeicola vulgatus]|nr:hypothetical protein [Phocaeicola vulgatus]